VQTTDVTVLANRITNAKGHGIRLSGPLVSAMIKQNIINTVGGGGIVMDDNGSADRLSIENNDIETAGSGASAATADAAALRAAGIRIGNVGSAIIAENQIVGVKSPNVPLEGISCHGFQDIEVSGNTISGTSTPFVEGSADIFLNGASARVMKNVVRRNELTVAFNVGIRWPVLRASAVTALIAGSNIFETLEPLQVSMVQIIGGHCTFADNFCAALGNSTSGNPASAKTATGTVIQIPVVVINSTDSVIVTSNRVEGAEDVAVSLTAPDDGKANIRWTVLGNITDGKINDSIHVNGTSLPNPWSLFNRQL
jgi:hypothetical protein